MSAARPGPAWRAATLLLAGLLWCGAVLAHPGTLALRQDMAWPLAPPEPLWIHDDLAGSLTARQAAALPLDAPGGYARANPDNLAAHRIGSVRWLLLPLANASAEPLALVFVPGVSHVEQVDFHVLRGQGWTRLTAGAGRPMSAWTHPERRIAARLTLAPGETARLLVQLRSQAPHALKPRLYSLQAYEAGERRAALWDGALIGGLLALAWCALLVCVLARNAPFLLLAWACVTAALFEAAKRGYAHFLLWPEAPDWNLRSLAVLSSSTSALVMLFVLTLARREGYRVPLPALTWSLLGMQGLLAAYGWFGPVGVARVATIIGNALFMAALVALAVALVRRSIPAARLILFATVVALFNYSLTLAEIFGWGQAFFRRFSMGVDPNPVVAQAGLLAYLIVLAAWIQFVIQQRTVARRALRRWQEDEHERLRREVARQTSALHDALNYARDKNRQMTLTMGYVGHDLRAPLAAVTGHVRLLEQKADGALAPHVHAIERNVQYQIALIDDLLDYARGETQPLALAPAPTRLEPLLRDVSQYTEALCAPHGNRYVYSPPARLPRLLHLDGRRLQQVLLNLLANAAKFTRHGEVRLRVAAERRRDGWRLAFDVSDTGPGIDLPEQAAIFSAFQQFERSQGGVGLGLFIARRIVQQMGGTLRVASAPGQGCRFSFDILAHALSPEAVTPAAAARPAARARVRLHLPDAERMRLAILARDGQLTEIEHWVARIERLYPACVAGLDAVRAALAMLDFPAIEALALERAPPAPAR